MSGRMLLDSLPAKDLKVAAILSARGLYAFGRGDGSVVVGRIGSADSRIFRASPGRGSAVQLTFNSTGERLIVDYDDEVWLVNLTVDDLREMPQLQLRPGRATFSATGERALTWTSSGRLSVWDSATGDLVAENELAAPMPIRCSTLSADGRRAFFAFGSGEVASWDLSTGSLTTLFHSGGPTAICFMAVAPDDSQIMCLHRDGVVAIMPTQAGETVIHRVLTAAHSKVLDVFFESERIRLAYDSFKESGTVEVWDVPRPRLTPVRDDSDAQVSEVGSWLAQTSCLLVAGPELPTIRGLPGRDALLRRSIQSLDLPSATRSKLENSLEQGSLDRLAPLLRRAAINLEGLVDSAPSRRTRRAI